MPLLKRLSIGTGRESGATLMETVVALGILATIVVVFLAGITGTTKAAFLADEQTTAESLAQSQMEWVQSANYTSQYSPALLPSGTDNITYSANITAVALNTGIQKITVIIQHSGKSVLTLESYKVDRDR